MRLLKILDVYILKRYLGSFCFIIALFSILAMVIDFSEKVEDFMQEDGPTTYQIIFEYYINFLPWINGIVFPLYNLIAVVFFTARLAAHSEFIAAIGNGVSFYRILRPYLIGAFIIAGIHYMGNHYIIPLSNQTRVHFENTYVWHHNYEGPRENIHLQISPTEEVFIQYFNRNDSSGRYFSWIFYDSTGIHRTGYLSAREIEPLDSLHWRLKGVKERIRIDSFRQDLKIYPHNQVIDTTINFAVSDILRRNNLKDAMTTNEIIDYIDREQARGSRSTMSFEVERYRRSADAFSIFILTLIGFSIAARKMRGGIAWQLVLGLALSALYILVGKFSMTFSTNGGLAPWLGVWIPNIVFSFIAFYIVSKAQK